MGRSIQPLHVSETQRTELTAIAQRPTSSLRMARRARMILLCADGRSQEDTAAQVGVRRTVVSQWEKRFRLGGVGGLAEAPRSGRKPSLSEEVRAQIISEATRPPKGRTQWSTRTMARAKGVSNQTVHKLWRATPTWNGWPSSSSWTRIMARG